MRLGGIEFRLFSAGLIGWVGGETIVTDVAFKSMTAVNPWLHCALAASGAMLVVGVGKWLTSRSGACHCGVSEGPGLRPDVKDIRFIFVEDL